MNFRKPLLSGLFAVAALSLNAGCIEECVDRFDCAAKGENQICVDHRCVQGDPPVEEEGDAGETDAGEVDAGPPEDAGTEDAGGVDAGEEDAGMQDGGMVDAGPDCTPTNPSCTGPFRCTLPGNGDAGVCSALWIGVTEQENTTVAIDGGLELDGGVIDAGTQVETSYTAYIFPFNAPGGRLQLGSAATSTRYPRFSAAGDAVVYIEEPLSGPTELRRRAIPGTSDVKLTDADDAGTLDFTQLEYAPSTNVLWTKVGAMNTRDGIQYIPGTGGAVKTAIPQGAGYGDWISSQELVFGGGNLGRYSLADGGSRILHINDAVEPTVSPDGQRIAYLVPDPAISDVFATALWSIATDGGAPTAILPSTAPVGSNSDGGAAGSYGINPSWVGGSSQVAYVRVSYYRDAMGVATLCTPQDAICAGRGGQVIVFQTLDGNGAPTGAETVHGVGVQPSVSPDGAWLAYVITGGGGQSELHVVPINAAGAATDAGFTHTFPLLNTGGKDAKPRWQPK